MIVKLLLCSMILSICCLAACKKKDKTPDENASLDEVIEVNITATPLPSLESDLTLSEILGTASKSTPTPEVLQPTTTLTPEVVETTPTPIVTPDISNVELADTLFNLLAKQEDTDKEESLTQKTASDSMTIFANNIKGNNYISVNSNTHVLNNVHECTLLSKTDNGSIIQFKSDDTTNTNSILVVYVTDLTAWTVIGENNVIYALMPTPENTSTEYEKQIVSAIIDQHSNGKELDVQLIYPVVNAFDGKNNCAVYMITTDGTFNIGSNAKTYAFYKYDYIK